MKKVAIYIRYPYDGDGGIDILQQLKDFSSTKKDWEVKEIFQDFNCSEKGKEKPEFERMINMCCNNKFDIILVLGIYQIAKDTTEFLNLEQILTKHNVKIYSKSNDMFVEIIDYLNNRSVESILSFLNPADNSEEQIDERYNNMKLRLETLQKVRWSVGESLIELFEMDYLIEAYEILNEVERRTWNYINEGTN
ncbi:MAG: recombinase family protein [Bacilli bacterium]